MLLPFNCFRKSNKTKSIVVIGGLAAGKTCLTTMMTDSLMIQKANVEFLSGMNFMPHYHDGNQMLRAIKPTNHIPATRVGEPNIIRLCMSSKNEKNNMISIVDLSTEELIVDDQNVISIVSKYENAYLGVSSSQEHVHGWLLVINPLLFGKNDYRNVDEYSRKTQNEILSRIVSSGANREKIAIVFTRTDIPEINDIMGDEAIREYMSKVRIDRDTAIENLIKNYLLYYKQFEFLNCIESEFKNKKFFVSGMFDDYLHREHLIDPLLWLIE